MILDISDERRRQIDLQCEVLAWKRHVRTTYGIDDDSFGALLEKQKHSCAICDSKHSEESRKTRLVVDHDHETGKIRGLLCMRCNMGIGHLGDNSDGVKRALAYLTDDDVRQRWRRRRSWLFQDHKTKELKGDKCPWSIGWYDNKGKRRSKVIGNMAEAESAQASLDGKDKQMSATHSYAWKDESLAEVAAKTEIAGQVVAALAAKQQMQPLDDKERAVYQAALDYLMGSFKK